MKKDTINLTVGYQYRHMVISHIISVFVSLVLQLIVFSWMLEKPILKEIDGILFTIIYFFTVYGAAGGVAKHDNKSYTKLQPDMRKGFFMGLMLSVITIILFIAYKFVWFKFGVDGSLQNWAAMLVNGVFVIWTFPYFGLMNISQGSISIYSIIIMIAVPIAASTLGYIAVCKKFDLWDKIISFVYVKKDK